MALAVPWALVGVLTAAIFSAQPPGRPDFSGEWRMNRERTRLEIAMPDSTVFRIVHREPSFELSRTHVFEGKSDFFSISLTTDGHEVVVERSSGVTLHSRAFWEGDRLVFASRIVRDGEEATNRVVYSLSADGRVFTAEESFRGASLTYDNVWVFDRVAVEPGP